MKTDCPNLNAWHVDPKLNIKRIHQCYKVMNFLFKRTVPRSTNARRTRQKALPAFAARLLKSTNARRTRGKLLSTLSAIAAPSASTLQNLCTFLGKVPALGAAMAESAVKKKIIKFV